MITFVCEKDPVLAKSCRLMFEKDFTVILEQYGDVDFTRKVFHDRLMEEAKKQEWYDFTTEGDGDFIPHRRKIVYNEDGSPKLLVPTVMIE